MFSREFVRPLRAAENDFLQVLLTKFQLKRTGGGARLSVQFDGNTPAIWSRAGKSHVREHIRGFDALARKHAEALRAFFAGNSNQLSLSDAKFPFRYASGGVLPIINIGGKDYFCLVYRECFPIGWNLANGGTDARHELLHPTIAIERELREELLILDRAYTQRYEFDADSDNPTDMPEYVQARRLWQAKLQREGWPAIDDFERILAPTKWLEGPDSLDVAFEGSPSVETTGCYLNIRAEDFGIEVDRLAKISLDEGVTLCDGELVEGQLVNSVVGLFEMHKMMDAVKAKKREFLPDRFFHNGRSFERPHAGELQRTVENSCSGCRRRCLSGTAASGMTLNIRTAFAP